MMGMAKALTISEIKSGATIADLDDVVSIHAVVGACVGASVAIDHSFALAISTSHDLGTPCPEFGRLIEWISLPRWQLGRAGVEGTNERAEGAKLGHQGSQCDSVEGERSGAEISRSCRPLMMSSNISIASALPISCSARDAA